MPSLQIATLLGLAAVGVAAVAGLRWWRLLQEVRLPPDATPYVAASALAVLLGLGALAAGAGAVGGVAAAAAMAAGLAFLALFAASGQAATPPAVAVGEPALDLTATDADGRAFSFAHLRGRPVLVKFFRGHWCPYCMAELRRWEAMRPALEALGVAIVTVSADGADAIRAGRARHGLRAVMLPDPDLVLTDRWRLRNPRNFALKTGVIVPLPIPTTILIDAAGVVRWIDQATDYMRRSDPERVLGVIRERLAPGGEAPRRVAAAR